MEYERPLQEMVQRQINIHAPEGNVFEVLGRFNRWMEDLDALGDEEYLRFLDTYKNKLYPEILKELQHLARKHNLNVEYIDRDGELVDLEEEIDRYRHKKANNTLHKLYKT